MRLLILALALLPLSACESTYQPAGDGRVSVIDLVMFPSAYQEQTVIAQGFLRWRDNEASLYFDKDHLERLNARFSIPLVMAGDSTDAGVAGCNGREVLAKGIVRQRDSRWVIDDVSDFVC